LLTTLVAIYGALLSSILAWLEYRKGRPLAHIRYDDFAGKGLIDVSVVNRSDVDIVLRRPRILFTNEVKIIVGESIRENLTSLFYGNSTLVRAGGNCTITFHLPHEVQGPQSYFALISWRRLSGLAAPTVPLVIRLPCSELASLSRDP
jgi:hypothetical protein